MALPKINAPIFQLKLPSTGQNIRFRPFLVREEKILLIAQESKDPSHIIEAVVQVLNNCIIDDINVKELPAFDLEYLFLKLRSKSVNNIVGLKFRDNEDDLLYDFEIDLDTIEVVKSPTHTNKIVLTEDVGVVMRYPSISVAQTVAAVDDPAKEFMQVVAACIESVWDEDTVYEMTTQSAEEVDDFLSSLSVMQFQRIKDFFDTAPKLTHTINYKNSKGSERKIVLNGLNDFFQ